MGSPGSKEDIRNFLKRIFTDDNLIKLPFQNITGNVIALLRAPVAEKHYEKAGGNSPLLSITHTIAKKLRMRFLRDGYDVEAAFTHSAPYLEDLSEKELYVFPLYPQYSYALTGAIERKLPEAKVIKNWHLEEEFIECYKKRIEKVLAGCGDDGVLFFIAHSIPIYLVEKGDPYISQVEETYDRLRSFFKKQKTVLTYIGKTGPVKWAGPEVKKEMRKYKDRKNIICVYLSMPVDNIEVLYDIDCEIKKEAEKLGCKNFIRVELPNDNEDFIDALEKIIRRKLL